MWYWFDNINGSCIKSHESDNIEREYVKYLAGTRNGLHVYYGFGNGLRSYIDFNAMIAYCASGEAYHIIRAASSGIFT